MRIPHEETVIILACGAVQRPYFVGGLLDVPQCILNYLQTNYIAPFSLTVLLPIAILPPLFVGTTGADVRAGVNPFQKIPICNSRLFGWEMLCLCGAVCAVSVVVSFLNSAPRNENNSDE